MSNSFSSKLQDETLAPFLKKDAIVTIKIGTGYLQQIASIITLLVEGKTQEDLKNIEEKIKNKEELEPWMAAIATLQVLIRTVFEEADKEGLVEYKNLEESLKEDLDIPSSTIDNLPSEQSPE
jgi:hypothetical protein